MDMGLAFLPAGRQAPEIPAGSPQQSLGRLRQSQDDTKERHRVVTPV